ncbi:MAG TPA: nuclear transport factor 2 family protein, partial [Anaeromyxobacteraceae bacterium]|nr:nuclear transport factor 2 family protein [Anaeromyxobacteraceae bacterium]
SKENVDVVRRFHAAYDEADFEAMLDLCTADVHWYPDAAVFPEGQPTVGLEPLKSFLIGSAEPWVRPRYPITEASELGDDRVLIRGELGGRGAASGVEMFSGLSAVYTLEHGRISKAEFFFDHERALKAAGRQE